MRLVIFGTGPFAAPMLRALYDTPHTVLTYRDVAAQRGKTIRDLHCDRERTSLRDLQDRVDVIVGSARWIGRR